MQNLPMMLLWYPVFLFSLTFHEAAHALVAKLGGDLTAYQGGQVTLNPIPHIKREPLGTVLAPIISFFLAGWMIGWANTPFDPNWARQHPHRAAWMALAGPAANLLLVIIAGLIIRIGMLAGVFAAPSAVGFSHVVQATAAWNAVGKLVSILFTLNLLLFVFNLFPVPPLDGGGALPLVLPAAAAARWRQLINQPVVGWVGIILVWNLISYVFGPALRLAVNVLYPSMSYG